MSLHLGGLAPDLLSAVALAGGFARGGRRTVLCLDVPENVAAEVDAAVSLPPGAVDAPRADAAAAVLREAEAMVAAGAAQIIVADGTPRHGLAALTEALARRLGTGLAVIAPASPGARRTVYQGHLFQDANLPDSESLVRVWSHDAGGAVGLVPFTTVEAGAAAIRRDLARLAEGGRQHAVLDALTAAHLDAIAEAVAAYPLILGSTELAARLAARFPAATMTEAEAWPPAEGAAAILVSATSRTSLAQLGAARARTPLLELDPLAMPDAEAMLAAAEAWLDGVAAERVVVVSTALPPDRLALAQRRFGAAELDARLGAVLRALAVRLRARGVRKFLASGATAASALVGAVGSQRFTVGAELAEGLSWLRGDGDVWLCLSDGEAGGRMLLTEAFEE
ncbi:four-carbon acid sugar kinase family protein [Roseomonas elaeocarpi]|uniref:Four-carbon acid sugar kinase family protein n=1 Tax=Roseomonas elaeocarpi TaxID=907779 RepID=A0ABV6JUC7_9PROT